MAISIIQEPEDFSLSKNQIPLVLQSNSYIAAAGVKAACNIGVITPIGLNEKFTFSFNGFDHEFIFVDDATTPTCTQVYRNNTDLHDPDDDWINSKLIPQLRKNYYIEKYFDLAVDTLGPNFSLSVQAKLPGAQFTFGISAVDSIGDPSTTILPDTITDGVDETKKPNYKLYCEVYCTEQASGSYFLAGTAEADVDSTGIGYFNLQSILHQYLFNTLPHQLSANFVNLTFPIRKYYYVFGEKYGTPVKFYCHSTPDENAENKTVLLSGVSTEEYGKNKLATFENVYLTDSNNFLSMHTKVYMPRAIPNFLLSAIATENGNWFVRATANKYAGSPVTSTSPTYAGLIKNKAYAMQIKALFASLFSDAANKYLSFEFTNSTEITNPYEFHFIEKIFLNNKYFAYRNSFGVYEIFWATEPVAQKLESDIQNFEKVLPINYTSIHKQFGVMDKILDQSFEANTGYIGTDPNQDARDYSNKLKAELLLTTDAYVYEDEQWLPIVIDNKSFTIPQPQDYEFMLNFKYSFSYNTKSPIFNSFL